MLNLHSVEQTPTETSAGRTLLYINKRLSYQLRNDLMLHHPGKIQSNFVNIFCLKSINVMIVGCTQKHPTLQINDFKSDFVSSLQLKLQKESSRRIFLFGNFNIDLLKYELQDPINNFFDTLSYNFLLPHTLLPARISKTSTLIHNIFSNSTSLDEIESGNVTSTFPDHLPQFIFLNFFFLKNSSSKIQYIKA